MVMRALARWLVAFALSSSCISSASALTITFADGEFLDADWAVTMVEHDLVSPITGTRVELGGAPDAFRRIVNPLRSPLGFGTSRRATGIHTRTSARLEPRVLGPILAIDYWEVATTFSLMVPSCGVSVLQDGMTYLGPVLPDAYFGNWTGRHQLGLRAVDFVDAAGGGGHPDFSARGAPVQFGFFRSNPTYPGGYSGQSTLACAIDNWKVVVQVDPATAAAESSWGRLKSLYRGSR